MSTDKNILLGIPVPTLSQRNILEKLDGFLAHPGPMRHIVSLNPEILVLAQENEEFRSSLLSADLSLVDGSGVRLAARMRGIPVGERYTGVDFMKDAIEHLSNGRSRVLLLGGRPKLADKLAKRYAQTYPNLTFRGLSGIEDIKGDQVGEESERVLAYVRDYKPHIIFAAFGSPFQEIWFSRNAQALRGTVCVGVGGAFDFLAGEVPRAPELLRKLGLEWLFRLAVQPWRWKRQLRLLKFAIMVATS
jgi:N-acetylglucosaminyldiphosphoundecaprenol N-acetyl-beta-D-mannosaminyltransferase